jgi:hypothetical protein
MQFARILFAGALLLGASCVLPEEGEQQVAQIGLEDESQEVDYAIDEATALSSDSSEVAIEGDEGLLGEKDHWVCWYCHKDKDHKDGGKCPEEHCYHGKHKKKDKAKDEAKDECEDEHKYGCYFKECKKFD